MKHQCLEKCQIRSVSVGSERSVELLARQSHAEPGCALFPVASLAVL